jgi:hypothetical protein
LGQRLAGTRGGAVLRGEAKHFLNLLGLVVLPAPKDVGLAAFGVTDFVNLRLREDQWRKRRDTQDRRTIVPYVIKPTRANGGIKLRLTTMASLRALRSSSSKHVSTTKRKMGGTWAGLLRVYSIVVYFGSSSAGKLVLEISL